MPIEIEFANGAQQRGTEGEQRTARDDTDEDEPRSFGTTLGVPQTYQPTVEVRTLISGG